MRMEKGWKRQDFSCTVFKLFYSSSAIVISATMT